MASVKMEFKVRNYDPKKLRSEILNAKKMHGARVRVGVFGESYAPEGTKEERWDAKKKRAYGRGERRLTVARYMFLQHHKSPKRPFLWVFKTNPEFTVPLKAMKVRLDKQIKEGTITRDDALTKIGEWSAFQVRKIIRNWMQYHGPWAGENAESTVEKKAKKWAGSRQKRKNQPLIDSGTMLRSIDYRIHQG